MALKRKIDKKTYDALSDDLKAEYTADGEGYILDIDGDENPDELRRARDREKGIAAKAKKELKAAQDRIAELEADGDGDGEGDPPANKNKRKAKDIETLEAGWKEKEGEWSTKLSQKDEYIKRTMVNAAADAMASKISTAPKLMSKAIADRLTVSFEGDEPELVILGDDGKPSSKTLAQLEKDFVANKEFAAIILGTKASGGSAPRLGSDQKPAGGAGASDKPTSDLSKMSPKDLAAQLKARKEAEAQ